MDDAVRLNSAILDCALLDDHIRNWLDHLVEFGRHEVLLGTLGHIVRCDVRLESNGVVVHRLQAFANYAQL